MTDKLLLNPGAFIHLVRETDEDEFYLEADTSEFEECNPMGLRFYDMTPCYEENGYGVNDLYVLRDRHNTLWGVKMYRGLGKHDEYHEIFEYSMRVERVLSGEDSHESMDDDPLELFEVNRKATYTYTAR